MQWARGDTGHPLFQFVYVMLPNSCNQACIGCYTGQDKRTTTSRPRAKYFSESELSHILTFAKEHGAKAVVYGGMGELFTWGKAIDYIRFIDSFDLRSVVFTNGVLLSKEDISLLNSLGGVLIFSLRDTAESYHNKAVGRNTFALTLASIDYAVCENMHKDGRLAIEIPVTKENERRVLDDLLPTLRMIGIVPMIEEFVQISTSRLERRISHNFGNSRAFFEEALRKDKKFGIDYCLEVGTRTVGEPKCRRPLFSFGVFPNRNVVDCPSHSVVYGNLYRNSIGEIIYSEKFRRTIASFDLCPCSVFYTRHDQDIPTLLPTYLSGFA